MTFLKNLRLPYRGDALFSCLFLVAFLVPLAFDIYSFENFETIKFGLLTVLVSAAALVVIKKTSQSGGISLRISRGWFWALTGFLFWALLSAVFAQDKNFGFFGFYPRFTSGFLFYGLWVALSFLVSALKKEQLWFLIKIFFICSVLTAAWGMLQSLGFGFYGGVSFDFFSRAAPSFLGNPNFSSMFIVSLVPAGVYFFFEEKRFALKVYYFLALFLQIWSVVIFSSRGSLLGLGAGLFICLVSALVIKRQVLNKFIVYCLLFLLIALGLNFAFLDFSRPGILSSSISLQETNIQTRLSVWQVALDSIFQRPIVGSGLGNFQLVYEQSKNLSFVKTGFFDDPHNLFLYLAVCGGIPLLLFFLLISFLPAVWALKNFFQKHEGNALQIAALLGCLSAWLVAAFFTPVAIPCYVVLVFLLSAFFDRFHVYKPGSALIKAGKITFCIVLIFGLAFFAAEHLFFASLNAYNSQNFKRANKLAKAASYLNPSNSLYFGFIASSAIRADLPQSQIDKEITNFTKFHQRRAYSYIQLANIYYLAYYKTLKPEYKTLVLNNVAKAMELDPNSVSHYFMLGQFYFAFGDLEKSVNAVKQGLEKQPDNVDAIMFLAKLYQISNDRTQMLEALRLARNLNPYNLSVQSLIRTAETANDIRNLPFGVRLNVGKIE